MVNHELWRDVTVEDFDLCGLGVEWYSVNHVVRYADVLVVDDPVISAFKLVFYHRMNQLSRFVKNIFL